MLYSAHVGFNQFQRLKQKIDIAAKEYYFIEYIHDEWKPGIYAIMQKLNKLADLCNMDI